VGGIKEKVLAARRAGIKRVLLPARNQKDFDDIPERARGELEFVWAEQVDDAVRAALGGAAERQDDGKKELLPDAAEVSSR
ncbi:MAG: hypothetical protein OET79_14020, partial [Nitrospirota bacterium]|nr:hypothetical protein [Nitrospirota bacterium]